MITGLTMIMRGPGPARAGSGKSSGSSPRGGVLPRRRTRDLPRPGPRPRAAPARRSCGGLAGRAAVVGRLDRVLPRTAPRPLPRHHDTGHEQLAAPDTPRLPPLQSTREALLTDRAVEAECLRRLDVCRGLGEEDFRINLPARQLFQFLR